MRRALGTAALLGLVVAGCRSTDLDVHASPYPPVESGSFGSMRNVSVSGAIWFGATPQEDDLELALRRGVTTVLDLSTPEEPSAIDVEQECRRLGLSYRRPDELDAGAPHDACVDDVLEVLRAEDAGPILMYCGTGRRCAAALAIYRAVELDVPLEDAIVEARRAGMSPEDSEFVEAQVARLNEAD